MAITIETPPNGSPILQLEGQAAKISVGIKFSSLVSPSLLSKICSSVRFTSWVSSYIPRQQQRLQLQSITFEQVEIQNDDNVVFIKLYADVIRMPEKSDVSGCVILNGPSSAVLIVFRVNPDGGGTPTGEPAAAGAAATGAATHNLHNQMNENQTPVSNEPRPREYVLLVKHPRPTVGAPEHREIPAGHLGSDGSFQGSAFAAIRSICGLAIYESQTEDMTSLALSARRVPARSLGVATSPGTLDERVRLFLYRETVSREFIESIQKRRVEDELISVDLWTLNDAWRVSSDARSLASLFLFHELRYHQLMPKYRAPRETKKSPRFTCIADLNPNMNGLNLKVKVAEPLRMIPNPNGFGPDRAVVVVGDSTGVVNLCLDQSQADLVPCLSDLNAPVFLRNVEFDMSDGHISIVMDSFGKIAPPTTNQLEEFNFTVDSNNNVSATEYERVYQAEPFQGSHSGRGPRRSGGGGNVSDGAAAAGGRRGRGRRR